MADSEATATGPYAAILGIAKTLVAGGPLDLTLRRIVECVGQAMFAESATLGSYHASTDEYICEAGWREGGLTSEEQADIGRVYLVADSPELQRQLKGRGITERHCDDPDLSAEWRNYFARWGLKATLDSSLVFGGEVVGTLSVEESRFVRRFAPTECALFAQLCDLAAIGMHTAQQARLLDEARRQLR